MKLDGKQIILGDCHFGRSKFSQLAFETQMEFFDKQLFPYMLEKDIKVIIQLGDFLDNRKNMDIYFFNQLIKKFFDTLKKHNFQMIEIIGNHDIYFKNTRDINMMKVLEMMYPDNLTIISNKEYIHINGKKSYLVPWLLPNENLSSQELKGVEYLFGHFEIRNFQISKGIYDENSTLTQGFFEKNNIKKVFSGHYHLVDHKANISYIGTPYQMSWGDFADFKYFYVLDTINETVEKIMNEVSKRYVKIKYNSSNENGLIEIHGLEPNRMFYERVEDIDTDILKSHILKFYINQKNDTNYHEEVIFLLREKGCEFTVIDNQAISTLIGTDYLNEDEELNHSSTKEMILKTIESEAPELIELLNELLHEIDVED